MFSSGFHHTKMSTPCQVGDFQVSIHDSFSDRAVMTFLLRRLPERDEKGSVATLNSGPTKVKDMCK
jgi:hypothetical protein